ncbi:MAG TPA: DUF484 family protein [Xanthomonadales bacterium]|nr:DUF484 family protein [Xanthomonadales bacterium]
MSENKNESLEKVVADFLRKHPNFLKNNPEVLESQQLLHSSGVAASLIERQVKLLREKNEEVNRQLSHLIHVASENEQLMSRLHQLTIELMSTSDMSEFFQHLSDSLLKDFNADIFRVCLFDTSLKIDIDDELADSIRLVSREDSDVQKFKDHLEKGETVCGRLSQTKLDFLFDSRAKWVQSTALMPLGKNGAHGLMAIGSSDPARFYPGMGTLFLELLADVVCTTLANVEPEEQRRSA